MNHAPTNAQQADREPEGNRTSGCLTRLFWMFAGNLVLFLTALGIAGQRRGIPSYLDLVFWTIVVLLAAVRYVDIVRLEGTTAFGQRATLATWWRYLLILGCVAGAGWGVAHGIARV